MNSPRIHRLPDHLVNKIAAGEVVERPASVVKELVENSIDAGCARVVVELRDAGRQLVRILDDGIGMTAEEMGLALLRHATSKIADEADLDAIQTLGFRGEALPAICAVSRFSLLSCPRGSAAGTLVRGEGGTAGAPMSVAATPGTTVEIADLFFNTPGRLKFLKGARAELAMILRLLQAIALAHPEIHVHVANDGKPLLAAPRAATLRDRVGALHGYELAGRMLDVARADHSITLAGLVAPPQAAGGSRDAITLIVNGRPVRDSLLTQTLVDAYRPLLARDQFPTAVVSLALPPQEVDVNVHPTKAWVRFRSPRVIQEMLFLAVQDALRSASVVQHQQGLGTAPPSWTDAGAAGGAAQRTEPVWASAGVSGGQGALFMEEARPPAGDRFGEVVGQVQDTFIVSASDDEVFFIDQHVAHERVLFERLRADLAGDALPAQELLFPQPLDLAPADATLLTEWAPTLERLGFALEGFGGATVLLRSVPVLLGGREPRRLIERMIEEVAAPGREAEGPLLDRALAFVACRAAIKAPAPLEREEMRRLILDLSAAQEPYFCPHGRPVVSRLSLREIRRELRRTW
ncbi:MAG: DNA mismatch repair endonuclease MutL [Candidatus Rokubacteria bacterium]|nr:DNA mismatch repair endonuclease MutL [Candidatus Rokubacteria bacterium]